MIKKRIKRFILSGGLLMAVVLANPMNMVPMANLPTEVQAAEATTVEPRADEIVWMFRVTTSGQRQKRRWNRTRGYWVDPDWINY